MLSNRLTLLTSTQAALAFLVTSGCGSDNKSDSKESFDANPAFLRAALEDPIASCQKEQSQCTVDADGDSDAQQTCDDDFSSCLKAAADRAQAISKAVEACRAEARQCVDDGDKPADCRDSYNECTKAAFEGDNDQDADAGDDDASSPLPKLDGGVSQPDDGNSDGPSGGKPSKPPFLQLDSGVLQYLPKPEKCVIELRVCVYTSPAKAGACSDTARDCLAKSFEP